MGGMDAEPKATQMYLCRFVEQILSHRSLYSIGKNK
jgi:hypothetical protein